MMNAEAPLHTALRPSNRSRTGGLRPLARALGLIALAAAALASPRAASACAQSGHAWFAYLQPGQTSVNRGSAIWLTAAGVTGDVDFKFRGPGGVAASYRTNSANGNCVVNQELFLMNFLPGTYTVTATFSDGNTNQTVIDSFAGTLVVTEPPSPPPGGFSCGQPAHLFYLPTTVRRGSTITAGGVAAPGTFSMIRLKDAQFKLDRAFFYLPRAGGNCVQNQRLLTISVAPGQYIVRAEFIDQNNVYHNDKIGNLTVTP